MEVFFPFNSVLSQKNYFKPDIFNIAVVVVFQGQCGYTGRFPNGEARARESRCCLMLSTGSDGVRVEPETQTAS